MTLSARVESVRCYLASQHMYVEDEWLTGCVEYLSEDASNNYSEAELRNLAKEQWLLNDLNDICPGSLPANLKYLQKTVLNGRFVLQINGAIDIGTPAYQQYLKLQKVNMENVEATTKFEDKIPSHRMIKLYLTDGVQQISAIEYKPMRNLSCDVTPGCKILIKGPVECRRGVILLTESAIELLGGEVQEIVLSNGLAGLISSKLELPVLQGTDDNTTINHPRNVSIPAPCTQMPPSRINNHNFETTLDQNNRPIARVTSLQVASFADDDIDMAQLDALEAQLTDNPGKRPSNENSTNAEKRLKIDIVSNVIQEEKSLTINSNTTSEKYPDEIDIFCNEDEEYSREIDQKFALKENELKDDKNKGPISISPEPFVYIKQINDMNDNTKAGRIFRVKAQIMKLLSKLSVGKDGWSLKCTIVDGTGTLDVEFTSDVLTNLVGYSPQEMNQLKKQMATQPEVKEKAFFGITKSEGYTSSALLYNRIDNITSAENNVSHTVRSNARRCFEDEVSDQRSIAIKLFF